MSIRLNDTADYLRCTLGSALTWGTDVGVIAAWVYLVSDTNSQDELFSVNSSGGAQGIGGQTKSTGTDLTAYYGTAVPGQQGTYAASTGTWYWVVVSRNVASTSTNIRVFDDTSTTTPLYTSGDFSDTGDYSSLTIVNVGNNGDGFGAGDAEICNLKIHTGVTWTNTECRTESQLFGVQKTGGNEAFCWGLETVDANSYGLNEYHSSGENLTNSGAVNGASRPSQLESATSVTLDQEGFRWYADDGSESGSTALAAQDTGITLAAGEVKRLRTIINATGDPAAGAYQLEYRKSGEGTWLPVSN